MSRGALLIVLSASWSLLALAQPPPGPPSPPRLPSPLSPEQALRHFQLAPGLRMELVAAEPDVTSPVAMAFDEDGRLFVVEMRDYPNGPAPGQPYEGRIRVLDDLDGDGRYESASIYAEQLPFANGLMPWRGGLLVTAAPRIFYLKDEDGDGKAERQETLFEGFAAANPQLRVSHPILGVDNWVYVVDGLRGGTVRRADRADEKPVPLGGMDFRFDLIRNRHEAITGMGQFGNTFDDWGRRFVCTNRNHVIPIVMPNRYVQRNPYLVPPATRQDDQSAGGAARVYPLSRNWTTSSLHVGHFSEACGITIYRGQWLADQLGYGGAFICEPTGNLVRHEVLTPQAAGFSHHMARPGVEFLATPDEWFRPVATALGPDGALYVVDFYRAVIEHPEFMPPELKNRPDLLLGKDHGRIWRIVPDQPRPKLQLPPRPPLSNASTRELVRVLEHPEAWWRTTAQRLLLERQDRAAIEPLRELATAGPRLHALWLLDALDAVDPPLVLALLQGKTSAPVQEHVLVLAERWLAANESMQKAVIALATDSDARLRFQVALTLGEWDDDRILPPLVEIALAGWDDPWTRLAVASAVPRRGGRLLSMIAGDARFARSSSPQRLVLVQELAALVGSRQDIDELSTTLRQLALLPYEGKGRVHSACLQGIAEGMGRRGVRLSDFLQRLSPAERDVVEQAGRWIEQAVRVAGDARADEAERLTAIRLLAHAPWSVAESVLTGLLADEPIQSLRVAAVRALAAHKDGRVAQLLLEPWRGYPPAVRREVLEATFQRPDRLATLVREVEAGHVKPAEIEPQRVQTLLQHPDASIRQKALGLFRRDPAAKPKQALERYQGALTMQGDARRGRLVFEKHCATCHRVAGVGVDVGPDVADTRTKTPAALLLDILDPNAAIDGNYVNYVARTKDGRLLSGIVASETASSVTLRRADQQTDVVLRQDLEAIQSTGLSLMPEGLEQAIGLQEMADLIEFLKNWRHLDAVNERK